MADDILPADDSLLSDPTDDSISAALLESMGADEEPQDDTSAAEPALEAGDGDDTTQEPESEYTIGEWLRARHGEKAAGIVGKYTSDEALLDGLLHAASLVGARQDDALLGQQLRPHAREVAEYIALKAQGRNPIEEARAQQTAPQQQQQIAPTGMTLAEFNELRSRVVATNEHGQQIVSPTASASDRQRYEEATRDIQRRTLELAMNPEQALAPMVQQMAQQAAMQIIGQYAQQQQMQAAQYSDLAMVEQFRTANASWLYNSGTAESGFSPIGKEFAEYAGDLESAGASRQAAIAAALRYVGAKYPPQQAQKPAAQSGVKPQGRKQPQVANPVKPKGQGLEIPDNIDQPGVLEKFFTEMLA